MNKTKMLITGGVRSGKSRLAQELAAKLSPEGRVLYVATAKVLDEEMMVRVKKHQDSRPASWDTFEGYTDLRSKLPLWGKSYETVLIDCLTMLLTNRLFDEIGMQDPDTLTKEQIRQLENMAEKEAENLAEGILASDANVLLVTNEIGMGVVPDHLLGRVFRDMAGKANQILAARLPQVTFMVSGIPLTVKGEKE